MVTPLSRAKRIAKLSQHIQLGGFLYLVPVGLVLETTQATQLTQIGIFWHNS
jgi:hypothetical protein